jgi:hypothetical protein
MHSIPLQFGSAALLAAATDEKFLPAKKSSLAVGRRRCLEALKVPAALVADLLVSYF